MVFLAEKIRRKFPGPPTFLVLTDREDLDRRVSETFGSCGCLGGVPAERCRATRGADLIKKLEENPSHAFSLIQKFNQEGVAPIRPDHDIVILSDKAHRSDNGICADNMMRLLPQPPASAHGHAHPRLRQPDSSVFSGVIPATPTASSSKDLRDALGLGGN